MTYEKMKYLYKNRLLYSYLKEWLGGIFDQKRLGYLKITGTDIDKLLPPMSRFSKGPNNRLQKKATVIEELKQLIDKFKGLNCFE
jgi:hypothetical protein